MDSLHPALYTLAFAFLDFGCAGNFWMAYWRGGGIVPGAASGKRADEQAELEHDSAVHQLAMFAAPQGWTAGTRTKGAQRRGTVEDEEAAVGLAADHHPDDGSDDDEDQTRGYGQRAYGRDELRRQEHSSLLRSEAGSNLPPEPRAALQVKSDGTARFCRKCNVPKPDRAHHCSSCRRCILKMDHHCPWLGGGCVGWANYKFFVLALLYTGALGIFCAGIMFHELANYVYDVEDGFDSAPVMWAVLGLIGCIFGLTVGSFGLYHFYLACTNRSTIEAMEHPTAIAPPSRGPPATRRLQPHDLTYKQRQRLTAASRKYNVYDLGVKGNLEQVFGGRERWYEWVMPWGWPPGDGHSFPIDQNKVESLRLAIEAVYAEAAAQRADRTAGARSTSDESAGFSSSGPSDEDGPIRRA
ncbi:palmitoyltransferase for Vac8p [Rhodotorula sphaerocarpa]